MASLLQMLLDSERIRSNPSRRDTACAECMFGTGDEGFVVLGFRCAHHTAIAELKAAGQLAIVEAPHG